jgi:L-rhamnose mutarotase
MAIRRRDMIAGAIAALSPLGAPAQQTSQGAAKPTDKEKSMERVCFLLKVKPEKLEEYKERHRNVWPDMLQALHETGWHNYSIFLRSDGLFVGYFETPSYEKALAEMAKREVNARWQREMEEFFEALDGGRPDERFQRLEQVFFLA